MKVITIANSKGGCGKSTIACNLAICAALAGFRTVLVDADPQATSTQFFKIREQNDVKILQILKPTLLHDVKLLLHYDFVFVDAGGRDSSMLRSALTAATLGLLLIPLTPSAADLWATQDTLDLLRQARSLGAGIPAKAVLNQVNSREILSTQARDILRQLCANADVKFLDCQIGDRAIFKQAFQSGLSVVEYDPASKAAAEILALFDAACR